MEGTKGKHGDWTIGVALRRQFTTVKMANGQDHQHIPRQLLVEWSKFDAKKQF